MTRIETEADQFGLVSPQGENCSYTVIEKIVLAQQWLPASMRGQQYEVLFGRNEVTETADQEGGTGVPVRERLSEHPFACHHH
jgi:hypothetical protein